MDEHTNHPTSLESDNLLGDDSMNLFASNANGEISTTTPTMNFATNNSWIESFNSNDTVFVFDDSSPDVGFQSGLIDPEQSGLYSTSVLGGWYETERATDESSRILSNYAESSRQLVPDIGYHEPAHQSFSGPFGEFAPGSLSAPRETLPPLSNPREVPAPEHRGIADYVELTEETSASDSTVDDDSAIGTLLKNGRFKCPVPRCSRRSYGRQAELRRHYNDTHAPKKRAFWCPVPLCKRSVGCGGKAFHREDKLRDHTRTMHSRDTLVG